MSQQERAMTNNSHQKLLAIVKQRRRQRMVDSSANSHTMQKFPNNKEYMIHLNEDDDRYYAPHPDGLPIDPAITSSSYPEASNTLADTDLST